jgi:hypothetical protein
MTKIKPEVRKVAEQQSEKSKKPPTMKQRRLASYLVAHPKSTLKEGMMEAGYSAMMARVPHQVTRSEGFQLLCDMYGLNNDLILKSLVEDIRKKPQRRVGELNLGAEILGMKNRNSVTAVQVNINQGIQGDKESYK